MNWFTVVRRENGTDVARWMEAESKEQAIQQVIEVFNPSDEHTETVASPGADGMPISSTPYHLIKKLREYNPTDDSEETKKKYQAARNECIVTSAQNVTR